MKSLALQFGVFAVPCEDGDRGVVEGAATKPGQGRP